MPVFGPRWYDPILLRSHNVAITLSYIANIFSILIFIIKYSPMAYLIEYVNTGTPGIPQKPFNLKHWQSVSDFIFLQ